MTRITTAAQESQIIAFLQQNQSQLDKLSAEVSSGVVAQNYSGIAPQSENLVNLKAQVASQQDFNNTINTVQARLQIANLSIAQIQKSVEGFRELIPNGAFSTQQPTVQTQAKQLLLQVQGLLNVQDGTRYIFSGTAANTPPVDISQLPTSPPSLAAPVNGPPSSGGYYAGGGPIPPAKIDTQFTINYGITAQDANAFEPIIRVLNFIANTPSFSPASATDQANLQTCANLLDGADGALTTMGGNIGLQEAQLASTQALHTNTINVAQNGISSIQSADQATVITQLNQLDTQIQASYAATSQIDKLSLVNFLGGSAG